MRKWIHIVFLILAGILVLGLPSVGIGPVLGGLVVVLIVWGLVAVLHGRSTKAPRM
ncbi:MAG: hypothetical protein HKO59_14900 [Phycisphaerales bacterium]|nr:hypothetical protein [Phycisphaerae bacterium]NNF44318.1 hypothetical protein [Phycisphaerales bacterium]NNM27247.1 hypothetical protein [Phycisphaerales bacterium]